MSDRQLPENASLEYLKKLAKDRLREMRKANPHAQLSAAQLSVAREYGFSSWRALKAWIERRQTSQFEPVHYPGWTELHTAAQRGDLDAVRSLLAQRADPNARESG